jgi:Xaa-Pro aminopeptidase
MTRAATAVACPERRARLRACLEDRGLDALLVTDLLNIRYLTGFTGSNAALLVGAAGDDATIFCTDFRYLTQSADEVPDLARVIDRPCPEALLARASGRVGIEAQVVTLAALPGLEAAAGSGVTLEPVDGIVETLREIKDPSEIDALSRACAVADAALAALIYDGGLRPGRTERDCAIDLDHRMRLLGADDVSFETILAAGAHSAIPHHSPTAAVLTAGDLVKIDFGATVDGYHSDMTRTFVLGPAAGWQRDLHELVRTAQTAGRDATIVGASGRDVDAAARNVIAAAGHGDEFGHGLGHGVGLLIHEAPSLAAASASIMAADMCVTVEPGVYLPGRGGVRIEDSGVVRPDGYEILTMSTKELLEL